MKNSIFLGSLLAFLIGCKQDIQPVNTASAASRVTNGSAILGTPQIAKSTMDSTNSKPTGFSITAVKLDIDKIVTTSASSDSLGSAKSSLVARTDTEVVLFTGTLNLHVLHNTPAQTVQGFCSPATNACAPDCSAFQYTAQAALSKISVRASSTLTNVPPSINSAFKRLQNDSANALSYGSSARLMLGLMCHKLINSCRSFDTYCPPRSEWVTRPGNGWRDSKAFFNGMTIRSSSILLSTRQPTILRENSRGGGPLHPTPQISPFTIDQRQIGYVANPN